MFTRCAEMHPPFFFAGPPRGWRSMPPWLADLLGGGPQRAERGEVRHLILEVLREKARHGYEIIQVIEERTGGAYRPSPGTVYPTLQMLEELGQVRSREEAGKRLYELTPEGLAELDAHRDEVEEAWDRLKGDRSRLDSSEIHDLMRRVHHLMRSVGRALRGGRLGRSELKRVSEIIDEAVTRVGKVVKADED